MKDYKINLNCSWFRTPEYIKFAQTDAQILCQFLIANITRARGGSSGADYMYNKFFKKGILATCYTQENLAKYLGWHSEKTVYYKKVRAATKILEDLGVVVVDRQTLVNGFTKNYYKLGRCNGYEEDCISPNYVEEIWYNAYWDRVTENYIMLQNEDRIKNINTNAKNKVIPGLPEAV